MSFLFDRRAKKVLSVLRVIVAVTIILGMVLFFAPGLPEFLFSLLG